MRLDELLLARGLSESRARAQAHILSGNVLVNDCPVTKSGHQVLSDADIRFKKPVSEYASRGAYKLLAALDVFGIDVRDQVLLDIGQSTGGFTDVLLRRGVNRVIGVDVGYGQLHPHIRQDPRVWAIERCNARHLTRDQLEKLIRRPASETQDILNQIEGFVMDVAFISVTKILPAISALLAPKAWGVILIKPQFEASRDQVEAGGIIKNQQILKNVLLAVSEQVAQQGWVTRAMCPAPIKGAEGNQEYLLWVTNYL